MDTPFCGRQAASFCWNETLAGRQKPCRARQNPHQDESLVGLSVARKGYRIIYFCLLSVCILIICAGICVGFGAAFLAVLFILRPDGKTVRSGSAVHAARRARCFGVHFRPTKGVYGLTLQETALPCVTCRRYSDRAFDAVLCSLLQTDRRGSRRLLSFWPRSLGNAVRFNFGRAVLSFCRLPLFLFWQCSPAVRISAFLLCGRAYGNLGRTMRAAGRFVCRFLRFLRASDVRVSRKARPAFYGGRALWDVSRETLTNAALCATIDTQSAE